MESYYLIGGKIRFYFSQSKKILWTETKEVKLTPKEVQTLTYILKNADKLIKAEDIAQSIWGEIPDTDYLNKRNQAIKHISNVRGRIDTFDLISNWLETKEKQGYTVCCTVELITEETQKEALAKSESAVKIQKERTKKAKGHGISVFITAAVLYLIFLFFSESAVTVKSVVQLTALSSVSVEPTLSHDGDAIAFSHKTNAQQSKIYLKTDSDIEYRVIADSGYDQNPVFSPSGKKLAYHKKIDDTCEIRVVTLDDNYHKTSDTKATDCSAYTYWSSITWQTENSLFYTDTISDEAPLSVYHLDLATSDKQLHLSIDDSNYYGAGYYYVNYDHKSDSLFILDGEGWYKTNIHRLDADSQLTLVKALNDKLFSIAIFENSIVYKDLDNQLKLLSMDTSEHVVKTIYPNPLKPISNPIISGDESKIAFVSGEVYKSKIFNYSITHNRKQEIMASNFKLRSPKAYRDEVIFISRESGINQLYTYKDQLRYKLTNFNINLRIINYAASDDKNWLAISFPDKTVLYKRNAQGLIEVKAFEFLSFPSFSLSSKRLLLADIKGGENKTGIVTEFDLSKYDETGQFKKTGIAIDNAKFAVYHEKGIIYIPSKGQGVYLFTLDSNEPINPDVIVPDPESFSITANHLYVKDGFGEILRISINTGVIDKMPVELLGPISIYGDSIFYLENELGQMDVIVGDIVSS